MDMNEDLTGQSGGRLNQSIRIFRDVSRNPTIHTLLTDTATINGWRQAHNFAPENGNYVHLQAAREAFFNRLGAEFLKHEGPLNCCSGCTCRTGAQINPRLDTDVGHHLQAKIGDICDQFLEQGERAVEHCVCNCYHMHYHHQMDIVVTMVSKQITINDLEADVIKCAAREVRDALQPFIKGNRSRGKVCIIVFFITLTFTAFMAAYNAVMYWGTKRHRD